ncbi:hypothetical protein C1Y40_01544 [Mycobacterium talmoniae]|uniref:Uncharacterized protein n=1 Tax=Mycobacterium talmoniae TaxID=1858794 RepID=A0A2S8BNJ5_9MYCO|nr:hypothetical protein C1Y40_01544 [Mycobacterium talmoniae]
MTTALAVERSCALTAVALSDRRRAGVRLISGERRCFGLNSARSLVQVPYPPPVADWTRRTVTCGVALQCSPSKDRIAGYPLHEYAPRRRAALALVEGGVALGWVAERWPGLLAETQRVLPGIEPLDPDLDGAEMLHRAAELTRSGNRCPATRCSDSCRWPPRRTAPWAPRSGAPTAGCRGPRRARTPSG